jgi:hypothetical protein
MSEYDHDAVYIIGAIVDISKENFMEIFLAKLFV